MPDSDPITILDPRTVSDPALESEPIVAPSPAKPENPPAEFDYTQMVGAAGSLSQNWRDGLPENIRSEKCLDSIKTIGALAQSYVHAQHAIGSGKIAVPGEKSTPEEWNAFYKACGRPDSSAGYRHDKVELPDGITLDEHVLEDFQKFAYENGFSQKAYEAALAFDVRRAAEARDRARAEMDREYNDTLASLRTEFGGRMESIIAQCNKAMKTFGLTDVLAEHGLLNNLTIIKALAGIGEKISESRLLASDLPRTGGDPESRLADIRNNPDDPFYRKDHPAHNARVSEVNGLLAAIAKARP